MKLSDVLFFIMRHGETQGNKENIYRSWSNAPKAQLDEAGKKGAAEAGKFLKTIGADVQIVICDSLDRVIQSCEIAMQFFPEAQIHPIMGLHPLNMGDWTLKNKDRYPVEPFIKDKSKRIPNGDSLNMFDARQEKTFEGIFPLMKMYPNGGLLVGGHGSNVSYLFNHVFNVGEPEPGYEGLVDPGGVVAATAGGLVPLFKIRKPKGENSKKKESPDVKLEFSTSSGTPTVGFVTAKDNKPPRECHNCEYMKAGGCNQEEVMDNAAEVLEKYPKMKDGSERKVFDDGRVQVDIDDCCNFFDN